MSKAYNDMYQYLESKGFKPKLNLSNNICSKTIQNFFCVQDSTIQLVEPQNHRANAMERAIQTVKNRFIMGLSTEDKNIPLGQSHQTGT